MTTFSMPASTRSDLRRGIFYVIIATVAFSANNALVKWQVSHYPVTEVVFFRCVFSVLPCGLLIAMNGGLKVLRTQRLGAHVLRAILQFLSTISIFVAFGLLPLADAVAISYASPIFLTVLSIPLLGEYVGWHRWMAVVIGFAGVLIVMRPGAGIMESGAVFAVLNALLSALVTIGMRRMSLTESSTTLLFYQVTVTALLSACLLPYGWVTPSWPDAAALMSIGLLSGTGQYWWLQGFRFAPAAVAAPFAYSGLIWAMMFGFLVWGDVPSLGLLGGTCLVAISGLYIVYRETLRRLPVTPPSEPTRLES